MSLDDLFNIHPDKEPAMSDLTNRLHSAYHDMPAHADLLREAAKRIEDLEEAAARKLNETVLSVNYEWRGAVIEQLTRERDTLCIETKNLHADNARLADERNRARHERAILLNELEQQARAIRDIARAADLPQSSVPDLIVARVSGMMADSRSQTSYKNQLLMANETIDMIGKRIACAEPIYSHHIYARLDEMARHRCALETRVRELCDFLNEIRTAADAGPLNDVCLVEHIKTMGRSVENLKVFLAKIVKAVELPENASEETIIRRIYAQNQQSNAMTAICERHDRSRKEAEAALAAVAEELRGPGPPHLCDIGWYRARIRGMDHLGWQTTLLQIAALLDPSNAHPTVPSRDWYLNHIHALRNNRKAEDDLYTNARLVASELGWDGEGLPPVIWFLDRIHLEKRAGTLRDTFHNMLMAIAKALAIRDDQVMPLSVYIERIHTLTTSHTADSNFLHNIVNTMQAELRRRGWPGENKP